MYGDVIDCDGRCHLEKSQSAHSRQVLTTFLLAGILEQQPARRGEAQALYGEIHEARIRTLGQEHPETRQVLVKLRALRGEA